MDSMIDTMAMEYYNELDKKRKQKEKEMEEIRVLMDCEIEPWREIVGIIDTEPTNMLFNDCPVYKLLDDDEKLCWIDVEEREFGYITRHQVEDNCNEYEFHRGDGIIK